MVNPSLTRMFLSGHLTKGVILISETKSDFPGKDLFQKGGNQSNILFRAILNLFKQNKYLKTFLGCGFVGVC